MKKTTLIAGLLLALTSQLHAHAPGYLGKRFFVKPEMAAMLAFQHPTADNRGRGELYGEGNGSIGFNTSPGR